MFQVLLTTLPLIPLNAYTSVALLILLLPVFIFFMLFFLFKKMKGMGDVMATSVTGGGALLAGYLFFKQLGNDPSVARYVWFALSDQLHMTVSIKVSEVSTLILFIVYYISFLVNLYSLEYMKGKKNYAKYYPYLGLFTFAMAGIVLSDNLALTYFFWELVGFSSYLLIGFWFDKDAAVKAAKKAFLFNKIGDTGFLIALMILYAKFETLEISLINDAITNFGIETDVWIFIAGLGIFLGAAGKSAQFPLMVWLPDAMEGPTPVSALLHAATMVAAGVYLLFKTFVVLDAGVWNDFEVLSIIAFIGAITAIAGAMPALFQNDIKKVLAYSTISQLGYMMIGVGTGSYQFALFHLVTHAFFKACLFLSAGSVIHSMHHLKHDLYVTGNSVQYDAQDMRLMGGLRKFLPVTFWTYVIAALALIGVPLFSGYLSKEAIILNSWIWAEEKENPTFYIVPVLALITVAITAFYMIRQLLLVFGGSFRLINVVPEIKTGRYLIHEGSVKILAPIIVLSILSFFIFFNLNPFSVDGVWLFNLKELSINGSTHGPVWLIVLPLILISAPAVLAFVTYKNFQYTAAETNAPKGKFFLQNWKLDVIYFYVLIKGGEIIYNGFNFLERKLDGLVSLFAIFNVTLAHIIAWFDRTFVDGVINLSSNVSASAGRFINRLQGGRIQGYFVYTAIGVLILLLWVWL